MSVNLSIKGVPDDVAERLRARAERNRRSLQGELLVIVENAAAELADAPSAAPARAASGASAAFVQHGTKTIEQIAAEHRARFPKPIKGGPLAVDIVRADRDSR